MGKSGNDFTVFLQWALPRMGLRREGYRKVRNQVCKRINARLRELSLSDYWAYRGYLLAHPEEWGVLHQMMHISISRFFRDHQSWEKLRDKLLPELVAGAIRENRPLRCWSAGCASGEEPYSLALLWQKQYGKALSKPGFQLIATDADDHLLQRARKACYPYGNVRHVPRQWLLDSFREQDGEYCLCKATRDLVSFRKQDIREEMPEGPFDLVFCKNLVGMYFVPEIAAALYRKIGGRMLKGGVLLLGNHEPFPIEEVPEVYEYNRGLNIYRKRE